MSGFFDILIGCVDVTNNSRHARRLSGPLKPQANRTMGPPGVNDDESRLPGKSNPLQTRFFFISIAHSGSLRKRHNNEQSCQRQRKKPAAKMEKPQNEPRSKTTNRHTAFKITIRGDFYCFCIKAGTCIKKRILVFNIMYGKFRLDGDFIVDPWRQCRVFIAYDGRRFAEKLDRYITTIVLKDGTRCK